MSAKIIKEPLYSSSQLLEVYALNLGDFVELPNLAKCLNPSWSFGQLQAAWRGRKKNPHRHGARKPMGDSPIERVNPMFTQLKL
jgi:hypothetical protein